jgi:hypothetical protein
MCCGAWGVEEAERKVQMLRVPCWTDIQSPEPLLITCCLTISLHSETTCLSPPHGNQIVVNNVHQIVEDDVELEFLELVRMQ